MAHRAPYGEMTQDILRGGTTSHDHPASGQRMSIVRDRHTQKSLLDPDEIRRRMTLGDESPQISMFEALSDRSAR
jgi:hypothetical protein